MAKKLRLLFTLLFVMAATLSWGEEKALLYSISGTNKVTLQSGDLPQGITASYSQTYTTTAGMATSGNSMTFKLSNFVYVVNKITVKMKRNTSNGKGNLLITHNGKEIFSKTYAIDDLTSEYVNYTYELDDGQNEGDLIVKVSATENSLYLSNISVTYETSGGETPSGPVDPSVSFANESVEVEVGSSITNAITKPNDLTVSYSSDDANVATVNADGTVTGVAVGETTITASWEAVENKYNAGSKSFAVTVIPVKERLVFEKVTNANQLLAGNEYILVAIGKSVAMGAQNGSYRNPVNVTINDNVVSFVEGDVTILTLGGADGAWTLLASDGKYIGLTSDNKNELHQIDDATSNNAKWTVTSDFQMRHSSFSERYVMYNSNSGQERFASYKSTQQKVVLFVKQGSPIYVEKDVNAVSNNDAWGEVSKDGNVITATPAEGYRLATPAYTVTPADAAIVVRNGNEFTVTATEDCTVTINFEAIPTHTVTFSVNGETTEKIFAEGSNITFDTPADVFGKSFVGWTTAAIDGTTDDKPELVALGTMGTADVTYYAVYAYVTPGTATQVTDDLTYSLIGVTGTNYSDWSGKTATSNAVYAGQSAGGNNAIQLRSDKNNSGIVTTTSGGKVKNVSVTWNANTTSGRTLNIYGANTAYTAATDLYDNTKQGTILGSIVYGTSTELTIDGEYAYIGLRSNSGAMYLDNISITWESGTPATYTDYCTTVVEPVVDENMPKPIVFHDSGEYEAGLSVPMYAQAGEIYYTIGESTEAQKYTGPLTINADAKITAWSEIDGVKSDVVTREYTIKEAADEIEAIDGYYSIKNNGNGKYVNVAGRKTVTFTDAIDDKAGTVIKVKATDKGQVEVLRSQGVDLPGYAERAMNYVPKFVKLVADKLHAEGSGEILGEKGLDAIMKKFDESFDYHLYLENVNDNANGNENEKSYRIYGKTPNMKPVVDFYAENKADVDYKLPKLEEFINKAIDKVLEKTGGRGASILTDFSLNEIWQKMGGTLTEPTDAASTAKFYEEVLSSEANVWNFAYQTAMKYWEPLINHDKVKENLDKLGDYAKYLEKVEDIRPDFKYYIVADGDKIDFISEGNTDITGNAARTIWTMEERENYKVTFTKENSLNLGRELYTTLYVDFAYTLPETVKAYKVTAVDEETGLATKEEITGVIPAQTPVLLQMIVDPKTVTDEALSQTLTLSTEAGTAVTGNLLQGPDWLINKYSIKAKQVEELFGYVHDFLKLADVEALYDRYVKEYEYLEMRNAGTVNNKYFFGLSGDDVAEADVNICQLAKQGDTRKRLAFYHNLDKVDANKAFIPSEKVEPVYLSLIGDVNRDGKVNITDVTCQIDIVLGKDKPEDNYDYDAADLDFNEDVTISDVTDLIDVVLGKKTIE